MNQLYFSKNSFFCALETICGIRRKPDLTIVSSVQVSVPYHAISFADAANKLGLSPRVQSLRVRALHKQAVYPLIAFCKPNTKEKPATSPIEHDALLISRVEAQQIIVVGPQDSSP